MSETASYVERSAVLPSYKICNSEENVSHREFIPSEEWHPLSCWLSQPASNNISTTGPALAVLKVDANISDVDVPEADGVANVVDARAPSAGCKAHTQGDITSAS